MNFKTITQKNMLHNARKYISIYVVNAIIVALLFLFASLLFNKAVITALGHTSMYDNIQGALGIVTLFSMVFMTYSAISFLKYRGQEFGMYITLGMTSKNVLRLIRFEQLTIALVALVTGIIGGVVFGQLFYMLFQKAITIESLTFELSWKSILLTISIFMFITICTLCISFIYIKRTSLVHLLHARAIKDTTKGSYIFGGLATFLFILSIVAIPTLLYSSHDMLLKVAIAATLITPYFMIGAIILLVKNGLKIAPRLYQRNILLLSNVAHRFKAFRSTLYLVMLMLGGSVTFIGLAYSLYATTEQMNKMANPFAYMYVTSDTWKGLTNEVVTATLPTSDAIGNMTEFEFITLPLLQKRENTWYSFGQEIIISETAYNSYMNANLTVATDEAVRIFSGEKLIRRTPDMSLTNAKISPATTMTDSEKEQALKEHIQYEFSTTQIQTMNVPFANQATFGYYMDRALIVADELYNTLTNYAEMQYVAHSIIGKVSAKGSEMLTQKIREVNHVEEIPSEYMPASQQLELQSDFLRTGLVLFISSFIGVLFVLASGVVLFYKVLTDLDVQKQYIMSLRRIGATTKEIKRVIHGELRLLFFVPFVLGIGLGAYYFYLLFNNFDDPWQYMQHLLVVIALFFVMQFIFYRFSKNKYDKEITDNFNS